MKVAIFRKWISSTDIGAYLTRTASNVRLSDSIQADILLPSAGSTLAFGVYMHFSHSHAASVVAKLEAMQRVFENSFALFVKPNLDAFFQLQLQLHGNTEKVQLLFCETEEEAVNMIIGIQSEYTNTQKKMKQLAYFDQMNQMNESEEMPKVILEQICNELEIDTKDFHLLLDTFGTIAALAATSSSELLKSCPVEKNTAEKLEHFFSTPILDSTYSSEQQYL
mmetsp:Transcript_3224/g.4543  ORF Transcript_3224/g.4543 Transcript_3224/m.4543 type:complete len:223 (+) Transcript_3224:132-800(+)